MFPETVKLEDAMLAIIDYRGKTPPKSDSGKWLVTAKVVKDGFIREQPKEFIAAGEYDNWMRRGLPELGDVLVTTEAPLGQVAAIRSTADIALAQRLILLRADPDVLSQDFLLYSMQAPFVQHQLQARATGTTVLGIKQSELRKIQLPKPPMPSQLAIARALRGFDDLIENNRRRIEILEEMARLLYREWFVHFRFPGHEDVELVDSELGPIPEGWEVMAASEAVELNPKLKVDKLVDDPFITMGDLSESGMVCFPSEWKNGSSGSKFQNGDTLFARITPCLENGKTGFVQALEPGQLGRGSTEFVVFRGRAIGPEHTYLLARDPQLREVAQRSMTGASGRQRVKNECFDSFLIAAPTEAVSNAFATVVRPMFELVGNLASQSRVLQQARDLLLPRLVSGELDVSELDMDGVFA